MEVVLEAWWREEIMERNPTGPNTLYKVRMIPSLIIETSTSSSCRRPLVFSVADHVKILENALKREREKLKSLSAEAQADEKRAESGESVQEAKVTSKRELVQHYRGLQLTHY